MPKKKIVSIVEKKSFNELLYYVCMYVKFEVSHLILEHKVLST